MYKQSTVDGEAMEQLAQAKRPLGPGFNKTLVAQATSLEVWCASFMETGQDQDYTRFDLKKGNKVIASVIIPGY